MIGKRKNNMIKVYSHPRSGTHFLFSFLAMNFYPDIDLSSEGPIYYGHWSNRIYKEEGEEHLKLFGGHDFPRKDIDEVNTPMIYIYRDGRAVAYSIWKSGFFHKDWEGISFSDFLRKKMDWVGGMGTQVESDWNIIQHWFFHVDSWHKVENKNLLIIKYEDLKLNPVSVYWQIVQKFFPLKRLSGVINRSKVEASINFVDKPVGLHPNKATVDSYKSSLSKGDQDFFTSILPSQDYLVK